jgi:Phage tail assembly chaperone proteins, E, or 41 or 14
MNEHTKPSPDTKPRGATGPVGVPGPVGTEQPRTASAPVVPPEDERPADGLPSEVTVELGRTIQTHMSPTTTHLTFREPTAMDIDAVGNPVSNDFSRGWPPMPVIDSKKMTLMMARLANISPKSILEMKARDWSTCSLAVQIFFLPDLGKL